MADRELSDAPGRQFDVITPSANDLDFRAFYIAVSGTIDITDREGNTEAGIVVVAGTIIPVAFLRITAAASAVVYGIK